MKHFMMDRDPPAGRKQYRLGLLTLVAESTVPATRFEGWLPRTGDSAEHPAEIELWIGGSEKRDSGLGGSKLVPGGVAVRFDEAAGRASLRSPAGYAELDLAERWGRVSPRDGTADLHALLSACAAILMGRAGVVLVDASAIIDSSGGGWMIVGPREDRSALVRAFLADGCHYVSDDQVVVRPARNQPGLIVIESWHRQHEAIPPERWRPVARLRGILLARAIVTRTPLPWRQASRDQALASLLDASPHLVSDPVTEEPLRELLASCVSRPAVTALISRGIATPPGGAVRQLAAVVEAMT
jgi:hypothetical protein